MLGQKGTASEVGFAETPSTSDDPSTAAAAINSLAAASPSAGVANPVAVNNNVSVPQLPGTKKLSFSLPATWMTNPFLPAGQDRLDQHATTLCQMIYTMDNLFQAIKTHEDTLAAEIAALRGSPSVNTRASTYLEHVRGLRFALSRLFYDFATRIEQPTPKNKQKPQDQLDQNPQSHQ